MKTATDEKQYMIDWLQHHDACQDGIDWALENCSSLQDAWETCQPDWCIWLVTRPGVLDDRVSRLFGCWSVRQVWHLLTDERSQAAVIVSERYAQGDATDEELASARAAAWDAAGDAARAAWDAAGDAARAAAWAAAGDAAGAARAAWDAAGAAGDPARAAAWAAARDPEAAAQVSWLRENAKPNWAMLAERERDGN